MSPSFECEDSDTKSNVEGYLNIHEETMHGEIDSGDLHLVELHLFEFCISTEIQCISVEMLEPSFDQIKL